MGLSGVSISPRQLFLYLYLPLSLHLSVLFRLWGPSQQPSPWKALMVLALATMIIQYLGWIPSSPPDWYSCPSITLMNVILHHLSFSYKIFTFLFSHIFLFYSEIVWPSEKRPILHQIRPLIQHRQMSGQSNSWEVPWLGLRGGGAPLCIVLRLIQVRDSRNPAPPPSHLQTCSIKSSRNFPRSQGLLASGKYEIGDAPPTLQAYLVNPKFREHPRSSDVGPSLYLDPILSMGSKLSALRHSLTYLWDNLKELQSGELRPATFLHLSM